MYIIQVPISPDPVSGMARVARHFGFLVDYDGELVQQIQVVTLNAEGEPVVEHLEHLSDSQRREATSRYADQIHTRQTRGAYSDAKTGQVVEPDPATGERPAGAIDQRAYFDSISLGSLKKIGLPINDATTVTGLVRALIQQEILNLDKRGVF